MNSGEVAKMTNQKQSIQVTPKNFKSPSDMTLYSPGLRKATENEVNLIDKISNFVEGVRLDSNKSARDRTQMKQSQVKSGGDTRKIKRSDRSTDYLATPRCSHEPDDNEQSSQLTDQLLMQAEKFKARVEAPKGMPFSQMLMPYDYEQLRSKFIRPEGLAPLNSEIMFLRNFDQDDEFFPCY